LYVLSVSKIISNALVTDYNKFMCYLLQSYGMSLIVLYFTVEKFLIFDFNNVMKIQKNLYKSNDN